MELKNPPETTLPCAMNNLLSKQFFIASSLAQYLYKPIKNKPLPRHKKNDSNLHIINVMRFIIHKKELLFSEVSYKQQYKKAPACNGRI